MKLTGRARAIADGSSGIPQEIALRYREQFAAAGFELPIYNPKNTPWVAPPHQTRQEVIASVANSNKSKKGGCCGGSKKSGKSKTRPIGYGPGTELLAIHTEQGYPHCEDCVLYAAQMDKWGVDRCKHRIPEIVEEITPRVEEWVVTDAPLRYRIANKVVPSITKSQIRKCLTSNVEEAIRRAHLKRMGHPLPAYTGPGPVKGDSRVVIMAAGKSSRWGKEGPKHLAKLNGEPVLYRTVRLLRERGIEPIVTTRWPGQWSSLFTEYVSTPNEIELDRVWGNKDLAPCILLYGDCYYTERAIDIILRDKNEFRFFGRTGGNDIKTHGEVFAIKVNDYVLSKCEALRKKCLKSGNRCIGLTLYDSCANSPKGKLHWSAKKEWTEIDDGTDDLDTPKEFQALKNKLKPRKKLKPIATTKEEVEQRCQVLVTSFLRFSYLKRFVNSVRAKYPNLPILVADYSIKEGQPLPAIAQEIAATPGVEWHQLPFDSCLAVSRNYLVQNSTGEFVLLCEDDFTFEDFTRIERMLHLLKHTNAMMVGGLVDYGNNEGGGIRNWVASMRKRGKQITFDKLKTKWKEAGGVEFRETDLILNFWLARGRQVKEIKWDPRFKIGAEHSDYFIQLKSQRKKVIYTQESIVGHYRTHKGEYVKFRDRAGKYRKMLMKKWNMVKMPRHTYEVLRREP